MSPFLLSLVEIATQGIGFLYVILEFGEYLQLVLPWFFCQARNSVSVSSACSNLCLASTDLSIIDEEISHKGRTREILWHNKLNWLDNALVIWRASDLNSPTWGYPMNLSICSDSWAICSSFDLLNCSFNDCSLLNAWDSSCCFWIACWSILCFSLSSCSFNWSLDCLWAANYCSNYSILCCFSCTCVSSEMIAWSFSLSKLLTSDALSIVVVVYAPAYWEILVRPSEGLISSLHTTFVISICEGKREDLLWN